jgi:hypothetical protein
MHWCTHHVLNTRKFNIYVDQENCSESHHSAGWRNSSNKVEGSAARAWSEFGRIPTLPIYTSSIRQLSGYLAIILCSLSAGNQVLYITYFPKGNRPLPSGNPSPVHQQSAVILAILLAIHMLFSVYNLPSLVPFEPEGWYRMWRPATVDRYLGNQEAVQSVVASMSGISWAKRLVLSVMTS